MPTHKIQTYEHTCLRCEHVWKSHAPEPVVCAGCRSPYWNRPYVRKRRRRKEAEDE
jgi:hypothetical protein